MTTCTSSGRPSRYFRWFVIAIVVVVVWVPGFVALAMIVTGNAG